MQVNTNDLHQQTVQRLSKTVVWEVLRSPFTSNSQAVVDVINKLEQIGPDCLLTRAAVELRNNAERWLWFGWHQQLGFPAGQMREPKPKFKLQGFQIQKVVNIGMAIAIRQLDKISKSHAKQ